MFHDLSLPHHRAQLIDELDDALKFCIVEESNSSLESVTNYDQVKAEIQAKLENGLLTVTYPKTSAEQQAQRISIA